MAGHSRRRKAAFVCQSCGMPLEFDTTTRGDHASPSEQPYCSHCYRAGTFVLPDLTAEQMQARVLAKLRQVGVSESRARTLTRRIPSLRRWKAEP
jgi:transposase-like protein